MTSPYLKAATVHVWWRNAGPATFCLHVCLKMSSKKQFPLTHPPMPQQKKNNHQQTKGYVL